jgi:hypothetical protein
MQITLPTKYPGDPNPSLLMNTGSSLLVAAICLIYVPVPIKHPSTELVAVNTSWLLAKSVTFLRETSKKPLLAHSYVICIPD